MPYSKQGMNLEIEDRNLEAILVPSKAHDFIVNKTLESEIVKDSLDNPIGQPRLEELSKNKENIVIITSDHTRPVPSP